VTGRGQPFNFPIEVGRPSYFFEPEDKTNTIRLYNFKAELKVLEAFWAVDEEVKTVKKIFLNYYEQATSGEPVLLETLELIPDPWLP
jgi:hypothetical protein